MEGKIPYKFYAKVYLLVKLRFSFVLNSKFLRFFTKPLVTIHLITILDKRELSKDKVLSKKSLCQKFLS